MNGNEELVYCQNSAGYVFLTSIMSPVPEGFIRYSTKAPSEMDKVFAKLDQQERRRYAEMTERTYNNRKEFIESNLSNLRARLGSVDCDQREKEFIRAWIEAFNRRQTKLQQSTVYGVSAMQTTEAPLPASVNRIINFPAIPTISDYISTEWREGDGLPGSAFRRKYGIEPHSNDISSESVNEVIKYAETISNTAPEHFKEVEKGSEVSRPLDVGEMGTAIGEANRMGS